MNKKERKEKLIQLFDEQVPDQFNQILSKCQKVKKERKIIMTEKRKKFNWKLSFTFASCILLLIIGGGLFYNYNLNNKIDSIIDIDVNPSIELQINKKDKIVKYVALNDDAKNILQDMDLKNVDIDLALNAIIGSMVTKGYLDDLSNSILISVDNDDEVKAEQIRQRLANKIDSILNTGKIQGSVLSQTLSSNNNLNDAEKLAKKYNISLGKAQLIIDVLNSNSLLKEEDLVNLNINEINVLTQSKSNGLSTVEKKGDASTKAYISKEKAKEIALNDAKVTKYNKMEIEFDADNGIIIYDVEFETDTHEYDYEIDAVSGKIVNSNKEKHDEDDHNDYEDHDEDDDHTHHDTNSNNSNNTNTSSNFITSSKAKEIALNHAKVNNAQNIKVELDSEDREYSVEFKYNGKEYDYEIDAISGKIIEYDIEPIDHD